MRLIVDARELESRPTGVGRVLAGLLEAWPAVRDEIVLVARSRPHLPAMRDSWSLDIAPASRWLPASAWEQIVLPARARAHGASVLLCPAYGMPVHAPCPVVVGMHDCAFAATPHEFGARERWRRRLFARVAASRAAALFTGSRFAADEAHRWLGVQAERISVLPYGVGSHFRPCGPSAVEAIRDRYGLSGRTVLFVGSHLQRRGLAELTEAVRSVAAARPDVGLCLAGPRPAGRAVPAGGARWLGYVPEEDLPALYGAATVVAYPSLYEGFGLPVMEALACGTPVVTADIDALRETYAGHALLVPPNDGDAWRAALTLLLEDEAERSRWIERSGAWARARDWSAAAAALRRLLLRVSGGVA